MEPERERERDNEKKMTDIGDSVSERGVRTTVIVIVRESHKGRKI